MHCAAAIVASQHGVAPTPALQSGFYVTAGSRGRAGLTGVSCFLNSLRFQALPVLGCAELLK
jgi:hypothetical protein